MNAQKYFEQHAEELIARFAGKNVALFFRGFVPANVRWLAQREDAILPANKVLNEDGTISIAKIDAAKRKLVQSMMMQEEGVTVGLYEEMLAILQNVQDPKEMFDAEFIVVDNNAFPAYVPSCIPAEDAEVLYKAYETEKTELGSAEVLSHYYASVRMLNDRCYVALFNRHKGENIRSIDFYQKKQAAFTDAAATLPNDVSPLVLADRFFCGEVEGPLVLPVEREQSAKNNTYDVLAFAAEQCGVTFALNCASHKEQVEPETINRYRAILKRYWGANADFRMLDFYKDPAAGTETMQISQGEIISTIVKQCELALDGYQDYSNVFLTAPTGAGKSAFYQVSGIYLAQVRQAVTVVITPLIALMQDQVSQLEARGVHCATFLNSNVSHEEREERLNAIHKGEKSILYIAPEMLLTTSLETLLGGRRLGLFVVDEAHTVTSWGRDFRADYWFMGDYLERQRKNGLHFPVLCLTATAVYGGRDDVVQDTISTLGLNRPIQYLGRVRRDNIDFDIHPLDKQTDESRDEFKVNHVAQKIAEYVAEGKKTLVYCPFRSTVDSIYQAVPFNVKDKVRRYHAGMFKEEKNAAQEAFKNNSALVMICTKAFGMGVDVPDIVQVYHYAPTGNLADYVQEIGRCARDKTLRGTAVEEYLPGDLSQLKRLHGIGELRQYQLREMLHKLYWMYSQKKHRNLLVSPDVFSYLFNSGEVENRVKTGLLLLAKDLEEAYGFPVLVVRPKAMFTTCYANVPEEIEEEFLSKYGEFVRNLYDNTVTVNRSFTPLASDVVVRNSGNIYEIRMGDLWEKHFSDMTFGMFKAKFFKGELFEQDGTNRISVRVKTQIHYEQDFDTTRSKLRQYMEAVAQVFDAYRKGVHEVDANGKETVRKMFTVEDFCRDVQEKLGNEVLNKDFAKALLELFVMDVQADPTKREGDRMKFIQATQRGGNRIGLLYRVTNGNYFSMANWMDQKLVNCAPNREETEYMGYIPATIGGKQNPVMRLLAVLEIFGLASYEVRGGQNLEIFVRVNDPQKIRSLSESRSYKNMQLVEIHRRHADAEEMMLSFLTKNLTSKQRWDLVEDYFLGHDEVVGKILGLEEQN